jgi:hypothetical protein
MIAKTPRGGQHLVYSDPDGEYGIAADAGGLRGVDVRGTGGYIIVPSPASPGREWIEGDWEKDSDLCSPPESIVVLLPPAYRRAPGPRGRGRMAAAGKASEEVLKEVTSALHAIPPSVKRPTWVRLLWAVHAALDADERGADLVEDWSAATDKAGQYKPGEAFGTYSVAVLPWNAKPGVLLVDKETLFKAAYEHGWKGPSTSLNDLVDVPPCFTAGESPGPQEQHDGDTRTHGGMTSQPAPFPAHLLDGNDLVASIARWMVEAAPRPQPAFSFASALCVVATVLGRRVETETTLRTNLYVVGVGESGCGKEHVRREAVELLRRIGLPDHVGPSEYKSDSAVLAALREHPVQLAVLDELGKFLANIHGQGTPGYLAGISKQFLELFSKANCMVLPSAYADRKQHPAAPLYEPCLGILGFTTPSTLYDNLTTAQVADGLLGRVLLFPTDTQFPRMRRSVVCFPPPDDLVARLRHLDEKTRPSGDLVSVTSDGTTATNCRRVVFADEARDAWHDIQDATDGMVEAMLQAQSGLSGLWRRRGEHVAKVALVLALAGDPLASTIDLASVRRADELVTWCLSRLQRDAEGRIGDSDVERAVQRVLRIVVDAGPAGLTASTLTRKTQWLNPRDRKGAIETLQQSDQIHAWQVPTARPDGKGKPTIWFGAGPGDQS